MKDPCANCQSSPCKQPTRCHHRGEYLAAENRRRARRVEKLEGLIVNLRADNCVSCQSSHNDICMDENCTLRSIRAAAARIAKRR